MVLKGITLARIRASSNSFRTASHGGPRRSTRWASGNTLPRKAWSRPPGRARGGRSRRIFVSRRVPGLPTLSIVAERHYDRMTQRTVTVLLLALVTATGALRAGRRTRPFALPPACERSSPFDPCLAVGPTAAGRRRSSRESPPTSGGVGVEHDLSTRIPSPVCVRRRSRRRTIRADFAGRNLVFRTRRIAPENCQQ